MVSEQKAGFYFSCNADLSAHDYTIFVEQRKEDTVTIGARNKNSEPNSLYEMEMDAEDLYAFGQMCIGLPNQVRLDAKQKSKYNSRLFHFDKLLPDDDRLRGLLRAKEQENDDR